MYPYFQPTSICVIEVPNSLDPDQERQNVGTDLDPISLGKLVRLTQQHIGRYRFVYDKTMFRLSFPKGLLFRFKKALDKGLTYFHACLLNRGLIKDKPAKPADLR